MQCNIKKTHRGEIASRIRDTPHSGRVFDVPRIVATRKRAQKSIDSMTELAIAMAVRASRASAPVLFFCDERDVDAAYTRFVRAAGNPKFAQFLGTPEDRAHLHGWCEFWEPALIATPAGVAVMRFRGDRRFARVPTNTFADPPRSVGDHTRHRLSPVQPIK